MRAVCESFQMSKDAGFKVVAHMMPDLPNVGLERDIEQFIVSLFYNRASTYSNTLRSMQIGLIQHKLAASPHSSSNIYIA